LAFYDVFNGDADGICALQQLRLAQPRESQLVTGVKRDIALVSRVRAAAGDELTILDISLAENGEALRALLEAGAHCVYFDHHYPGDIPIHPGLEAHILYTSGVCTGLIVDEYLGGRFRAWAVVAAFGDNLPEEATSAATPLRLTTGELAILRELGECLNYNAYGDTLEDLHFHPGELYRRLHRYANPLQFAVSDPAFDRLRGGFREDLAQTANLSPLLNTPTHYLVMMPNTPWARRMHGPWANRLAEAHPQRAHAVLIEHQNGYRVSVRAPMARPFGADELCRRFPSGGGRPAAAGINALVQVRVAEFTTAFLDAFG